MCCLGTFPGSAESAGQAAPGTKEKMHPKPPDFGGAIARATLVGLPKIFGLVGQLHDAHLGGREVAGKLQDVQVRQGHRGGCQPQRARGRRLDLHRTLQKSQEPMVSLIQIDISQCIKCVEIITLDFCFVMWVDNEPTVGDSVVVVSSSTDSEAESGEGQLPGLAPGPQPRDAWRRSPLERQMEDMRRTLKRHTYRLSFIERSVVRLRQMVQWSRGIGQ
ncbi:UNVERIFIED_CONTAM: hypothetical protein K2H54_070075 [Gekko kuhli]